MAGTVASPVIGVIGLGIMGLAMARNLASAGRSVIGFDTEASRLSEAEAAGVTAAASAGELAGEAELVMTSLPSDGALRAVVDQVVGAGARPSGQILVELSTLSPASKERERDRLALAGVGMLDCPVSGTGAQAASRDIVLLASGERDHYRRAQPIFADFAREAVYLGAFGNGMRMKLVANLLVAIHNVAAAEAILLGIRSGLEPETLVPVLASGAGGSRMLQLRGPMMVNGTFEPATMKLDVWQKDMALIADFVQRAGAAAPLFSATAPLYRKALDEGRGPQDTAAVYTILEKMAAGGRTG
jgi:3-hydroxyisobutyrate dehydrogenase-like beta-hydroxyacid dehydrogenase